MRVPKLSVEQGTFSEILWNRFCYRYSEKRAKRLLELLSRPVRQFGLRVTITKENKAAIIKEFIDLGWEARAHPKLEEMILIRTKGCNAVPYYPFAPRLVVDKFAAESIFIGADLYTVGLKEMKKVDIGDIVSIISPRNQIVGVGVSQISSKNPEKSRTAVKNTHSFYKVPSIRKLGFRASGAVYSQSIPAAYVSHVLEPQPGEVIVDLCAAPGGKSTATAIVARNKAKIIAFDRSANRLQKMREIVEKQDIKNITLINENSIKYFKNHSIRADKVIVDPSCSAIGVRPKVYDDTRTKDITNIANYQKSFLWTASNIVRKGGAITYSTCTLAPEENEKVIAYAVNKLKLKLVEPPFLMGAHGEETDDGLELKHMRRFYPDIHDTPGFFVAKLVK